jgi:hypothetical protein
MGEFEDRLFDTLLREHGDALVSAPEAVPQRHWGRWVAAVGTVAAVAAGVLMAQTVEFGDQPAPASAAATVLTSAADRLGAADPDVRPGQYLYIETHRWVLVVSDAPLAYLKESVDQTWVPYDRTQEWVQRSQNTGKREWIHGSDADLVAAGIETGPGQVTELRAPCGDFYPEGGLAPCEHEGNWQEPDAEFVSTLGSDPHQLYQRIHAAMADEGTGPDVATLEFVAEAVRGGLLPADLRAKLYRALANLPILEVSDRNANLDGRNGIGLGIDEGGRKRELIIDPATGQFIGERDTATKAFGMVPAGTVTSYTALTTAVATEAGVVPTR